MIQTVHGKNFIVIAVCNCKIEGAGDSRGLDHRSTSRVRFSPQWKQKRSRKRATKSREHLYILFEVIARRLKSSF